MILIPVYNTKEDYFRESLESVLNQTYQDIEIIIVDDGSKNDIEPIIQSFNDLRIKFYRNEKNSGVAFTRNRLIDLAQGEYIVFQDADDISLPKRIEEQVLFLDENPDISVLGTWYETFPNKKVCKFLEYPKFLDFLAGCSLSQPTAAIRIENLRKYNLRYNEDCLTSEDYELWSRAIKYLRFANLQKVLLNYRVNPTSLVHTKGKLAFELDSKIKQELLDCLSYDKDLQKKVIKVISQHARKKLSFKEKLFSIRNEWDGLNKNKIIYFLGVKILIKKNRNNF